ncbi:putative transcription factor C2H2 family [Rosa chinensis]|uniref:Putative transcription factor C2H2 family n=1 Tax=Rosa chinensis TaxID=74649 RepID=A0A2P6QCX2_ROSCH|nr:putative transcription factor C2H2 family [Rosa chinensis]
MRTLHMQGGADELITQLPYAHQYHVDCIIKWLQMSHMCPLCRYPMPSVEKGQLPSNSLWRLG